LQHAETNHYATLGLDRHCTPAQIRIAYRLLVRQHHPDLNPDSPGAPTRTQALNAAYKILSDPSSRRAYDRELDSAERSKPAPLSAKIQRNISQDVNLRIEDFLRGTIREIQVEDPAHAAGLEIYELVIPPGTAPGARFRLPRAESFTGGFVQIRVRPLSSFRFKVRGSDLRCDLKIRTERVAQGGTEMIAGVLGGSLRIQIPRGVGRGEIVRVAGEGLPKPRGGRGDLLVRIMYRPEVRVTRPNAR